MRDLKERTGFVLLIVVADAGDDYVMVWRWEGVGVVVDSRTQEWNVRFKRGGLRGP